MVVAPINLVVVDKIVIERRVRGQSDPAVLSVDTVVAVSNNVVADIQNGVIRAALVTNPGQNSHVGLVNGVVVHVNVIGGVPHIDANRSFVVNQVVVDSWISVTCIVAADCVHGVAIEKECASRSDIPEHVVVHATGSAGVPAASPRCGRKSSAEVVVRIARPQVMERVVGNFKVPLASFQQHDKRVQRAADLDSRELKSEYLYMAGVAVIVPHVLAVSAAIDISGTMYIRLPRHSWGVGHDARRTGEVVRPGHHVNDISGLSVLVHVIERAARPS